MALVQFVCLVVSALVCGVSQAQCVGRVRSVVPLMPPPPVNQCPCSSPAEDLSALLLLARALDNDCGKQPANNGLDVEEIIMKLVNALIFTTTQNNIGGRGGSGGVGGIGGMSGIGGMGGIGGTGGMGGMGGQGQGSHGSRGSGSGSGSGDGLIDLDLLKSGQLLDLGLGGQKLLAIGLGNVGGGSGGSGSGSGGGSGGEGAVTGLLSGLL